MRLYAYGCVYVRLSSNKFALPTNAYAKLFMSASLHLQSNLPACRFYVRLSVGHISVSVQE